MERLVWFFGIKISSWYGGYITGPPPTCNNFILRKILEKKTSIYKNNVRGKLDVHAQGEQGGGAWELITSRGKTR